MAIKELAFFLARDVSVSHCIPSIF